MRAFNGFFDNEHDGAGTTGFNKDGQRVSSRSWLFFLRVDIDLYSVRTSPPGLQSRKTAFDAPVARRPASAANAMPDDPFKPTTRQSGMNERPMGVRA